MIYGSIGGHGCSKEQFTCQNKKCIEQYFLCDGNDNCGDGSDETDGCLGNCSTYKMISKHMIYYSLYYDSHELLTSKFYSPKSCSWNV